MPQKQLFAPLSVFLHGMLDVRELYKWMFLKFINNLAFLYPFCSEGPEELSCGLAVYVKQGNHVLHELLGKLFELRQIGLKIAEYFKSLRRLRHA